MACSQFLVTLLLLACSLAAAESRVLFRYPYSYNTFMRKVVLDFEKVKVETLGAIFKRHVQQLRSTPNRQVELVFLIDSSGTVHRHNFYQEISFVRNLLADFTVAVNSTRVSVITFSSPHKVYRYIDYLSRPDPDNHKCKLLNDDINTVTYTPGGTYTLGAFLEAEQVLQSARPSAAKAIFLMTDGYSNGGDPSFVAARLKKQGVKIFTFGIHNGNVWELKRIASEPKNETCYILDSFEEFEALARRALHADLQSGSYIAQATDRCSGLCSGPGPCCHVQATCSCGTYTGRYECLCAPGYYGSGTGKTGCKPCPPGTYKNSTGLGGVDVCSKCPDEHQTTPPAATSPHQCTCKRGYRSFGHTACTVFRCPELSPPRRGYFVNNKCNNVFNAACGLRCQQGYQLTGSSLRICQDDGSWSGQDATCLMKTCPSLPVPKNGHMVCSSEDFSYSTVCRFTCNEGYQLLGSRKRTCLAIADWTGITTRCREITCPPLAKVKDGVLTPASCTSREVVFGSTCTVSCSSGYMLQGPHTKQCTPEGTWTAVEEGANRCLDKTPPVLQCPDDIHVEADPEREKTEVTWAAPVPVDNSGYRPVLTAEPTVSPGDLFPIGSTLVTYSAEDLSQNIATCRFTVTVEDTTPPRVDRCQSPDPRVSRSESAVVIFDPPEFSDNSGRPVELVTSHRSGDVYPLGVTEVTFIAFDVHNNNSCTLKVNVMPHLCTPPTPPVHGEAHCEEGEVGVLCRLTCQEGYGFSSPPAEEYFCAYQDGTWLPEEFFPFPDCSVVQLSNDILQPATITLTGPMSCDNTGLLHRIKKQLEGKVAHQLSRVCEGDLSCSLDSMTSECEGVGDSNQVPVVLGRSRRSSRRYRRYRRQTKMSRISYNLMLEGSAPSQELSHMNVSQSLHKALSSLHQEATNGNLDLRVGGRTLTFAKLSYDLGNHTYQCPEGSVLVTDTCVSCPVGTFYNVLTGQCEVCPKGTYQPTEGSNTCLKCPDHTSTERNHTKALLDCKELCLPGTYSPSGLAPCSTCQRGFYLDRYRATRCLRCPRATSTSRRGARRRKDCAAICPAGQASEDGLMPCLPCPSGTYQHKRGQSACFRCPGHGVTKKNGATGVKQCVEADVQSDGFAEESGDPFLTASLDTSTSPTPTVPFTNCFYDFCENGGTCVPEGGTLYSCVCATGFTGSQCEEEVNLCLAQPCVNGGVCESSRGGYSCTCQPGFTGANCEVNMDDCLVDPCQNGGTCVDAIDSFTCNCPPGYTGTECEATVNDCADLPCRNGGTCINEFAGFRCQCARGYEGITCEIDVDDCQGVSCDNGGTCLDRVGSFLCECVAGYSGQLCEDDVDECEANPCQHGSQCVDQLNDYLCACTLGYSGKKCEQALSSQYQLDFVSATIMDYALLTIDQPLDAVTVAMWIRTTDKTNQGTPLSYAVAGEPNALTITDYANLNFMVNGESISVPRALNDGQWHHLAFIWLSQRGEWKVYVDGELIDHSFDLSTARSIPGKGILVLGQEQDSLGGGFSPQETFQGSLTHLNIWSKELSLDQIEQLRFVCQGDEGHDFRPPEHDSLVISWHHVQEGLKGNVIKTPSDFCTECPVPTRIEHGEVASPGRGAGQLAQYACVTGYQLSGKPELRCLVSGLWDSGPPTCIAINCGHPGVVPNGYSEGSRFTYLSTVTFKCNGGYRLEGAKTLSCDEYGEWDDDPPECVEITCRLPVLSQNTIAQTDKSFFKPGEEISITCREGSKLLTQYDSVRCQRDGSWDRSVPSCDDITCTEVPAIQNGKPISQASSFNVGDQLRYQCDPGHEFPLDSDNPRGILDCLTTGQFSEVLPECWPVECPEPPSVVNTQRSGEDREYRGKVTYTCKPGFVVFGRSSSEVTAECLASGQWSPFSIRCRRVSCGQPPVPQYGQVSGQHYILAAEVTYSCDAGYELQGEAVRRCEETQEWSGATPTCQPISCAAPPSVKHGVVSVTSLTYLSAASYSCKPGFQLQGFATVSCEAAGSWSPEPPTCTRRECPVAPDVRDGTLTSSTPGAFVFETVVDYTCNLGFTLDGNSQLTCGEDGAWSHDRPVCRVVRCPPLDPPDNGEVSYKRRYGSFATYSCPSNSFKLKGVETRTCQADGTWTDSAPKCESILCDVPAPLQNGRTNYKDLSVGSIVSYDCDRGYTLRGQFFRRCQDDLKLAGAAPTCEPVECPSLNGPDNGQVSLTNKNLYTSVASFTCQPGHSLSGPASRTCQDSGTWSGQATSCPPVKCPPVTSAVPNGAVNSTSNIFGAAVQYSCDTGYRLSGPEVRTCGADGAWAQPEPTCEVVLCSPPLITNGYVRPFSNEYGADVEFFCETNFRLSGPRRRSCQADGTWSGETPTCLEVLCTPPRPVANSRTKALNKTAIEYTCETGFNLVGASVRTCRQDQSWTPDAPICLVITCPDLAGTTLNNGEIAYTSNVFASKVEYSCEHGYRLIGNSKRECTEKGLWEGSQPTCEVINCGHPGVSRTLKIRGKDFTLHGTITFSCKRGLKLVGASNSTCQQDGTWDNPKPTCEKIVCPSMAAEVLEHGSVSVEGHDFRDVVTYACDDGYRLEGFDSRSCNNQAEWTGETPTCLAVFCDPPPPVDHGTLSGEGYDGVHPSAVGTEVFYDCEYSYDIYGSFSRKCQSNGRWSGDEPICELISCPETPYVRNGHFAGKSGRYGAKITLKCDEGFAASGETEKSCLISGEWSGADEASECLKISCGPPPPIANTLIDLSQGFDYGARVTYTCDVGYQAEVDAASSICLATKSWSEVQMTCTTISCPAIPELPFIIVSGSTFTYGSSVSFSCVEGYELDGAETTTCQASGQWDMQFPTCTIVQCPWPVKPQFSEMEILSRNFGDLATFTCHVGYRLFGSGQLECQSSGRWDRAVPLCVLVQCPTAPSLLNGRIINQKDNYVYNDYIQFACDFGYRLEGENSVRCLETALFDTRLPRCVRVACPTPGDIEFGKVTVRQDAVEYSCYEGFDLVGESLLTCALGGKWSAAPPTCQPVQCPDPEPVKNGNINGDIFTFENVLIYKCDRGYQLRGAPMRICGSDRMWSEASPVCDLVSCGRPGDVLEHGAMAGDSFFYEDSVTYSCDAGFKLRGPEVRTCQATGQWSGSHPQCVRLSCPSPPVSDDYTRVDTSGGHNFQSVVRYSCIRGYELSGEIERQCQASQEWSGQTPSCRKLSCGVPVPPNNGYINGDSFLFEDQVTIVCEAGFELKGKALKRCRADGAWTNTESSCERIHCRPTPSLDHGSANITDDSRMPTFTVAKYLCDEGYQIKSLAGSNLEHGIRTCLISGDWSEENFFCEKRSCPPVISVEHGTVIGDKYIWKSSLRFSCDEGFHLVGGNSVKCESDGQWSSDIPVCGIDECPVYELVDGSVRLLPEDESLHSHDRGSKQFVFGDSVTLACNTGHTMKGDERVQCLKRGRWSSRNTKCLPVKCKKPVIPFGEVTFSLLTYQSKVAVTCKDSYALIGSEELTCGADGDWEEALPRCEILACGSPRKVPNAIIVGSDFSLGGTIKYECKSGYTLMGNDELTCGGQSVWLGSLPYCLLVDCGQPPSQVDASPETLVATTFGSLATYTCDEGFTVKGDLTLQCGGKAQWQNVDPTAHCAPIDCGPPPAIARGEMFATETIIDSIVVYSCELGYFMPGSSTLLCSLSGDWEGQLPECQPVDCGLPPQLEHAVLAGETTVYQSLVTYTCEPGHRWSEEGQDRLTCDDMGTWKGELGKCVKVECGAAPDIQHTSVSVEGTSYQAKAVYACQVGFYAGSQENTLTCALSGQWEGQRLLCFPIECGQPPILLNGKNVIKDSLLFGAEVKYYCFEGFEPTGSGLIRCEANGQWSSTDHACVPVDCGEPESVEHAGFEATGTSFLSQARYTCDKGFALTGNAVIRCLTTGQWSAPLPSCPPVDCKRPPSIPYGTANFTDTTFGHMATYGCQEGFQVNYDPTVVCGDDGEWSPQPACNLVQCGSPPDVLNSIADYNATQYGSKVAYTCEVGFRQMGSEVLTCGKQGKWLGVTPLCSKVFCLPLPTPEYGKVEAESLAAGASATFSCLSGYRLVGRATAQCGSEGDWSSNVPICVQQQCPAPVDVWHATWLLTARPIPDTVLTYTCVQGYHLSDQPGRRVTLVCGQDGFWKGRLPDCVRVECGPLAPVQRGFWKVDTLTYGSKAYAGCEVGHVLSHEQPFTCQSDGQWAGPEVPTCSPAPCPPPPRVDNARLAVPGTPSAVYGAEVSYTCQPGHDLTGGPPALTCGPDGQWSRADFACTVRHCPLLLTPHGAKLSSHPRPAPVGTAVTFTCHPAPLTLVGQSTLTCLQSGEWDRPPPECQEIFKLSCGAPQVTDRHSVVVIGSRFDVGDQVMFMCRYGFSPVRSPPKLTCQSNGQWDGQAKCVANCKQSCLNGGRCLGMNRCKCLPGWAGARCELANCVLPCLHGGRCVAPYTCACPHGYQGPRCEHAICAPACQNRGRCVAPNKCFCPSNFSGQYCQEMHIGRAH